MLATQNPVDLDYKGLANAGTWFIGRLQTERDKARLLDGLEGAAGVKFDRGKLEKILSGLGSRVFLMNNVHEDEPEVFQTRWTMSYLRGPLARNQIQTLMAARKPATAEPVSQAVADLPALPPEIPQYFIPARGSGPVSYRPMLLGVAQVQYIDAKTGIDEKRDVTVATPICAGAVTVNWDDASEVDAAPDDLEKSPEKNASFAELAPAAANPKNYAAWKKDFSAWVFRMQKLDLFRCASLGQISKPGESERDFRVRLQLSAREERDRLSEELRKKYAPKLAALDERKRKATQAVEREKGQASQQTLQVAISVGTTLLGAFLGRKAVSASTLTRAATAVRAVGRSRKESEDVERAGESVEAVQAQIDELNAAFKAEVDALDSKVNPTTEPLEPVTIRPKKTNISVRLVALAWMP